MTDASPHFAFVVNAVVAATVYIRNSCCYSSCHIITHVIICLQKLLDATWQRIRGLQSFQTRCACLTAASQQSLRNFGRCTNDIREV
jgi:hypothetical protein